MRLGQEVQALPRQVVPGSGAIAPTPCRPIPPLPPFLMLSATLYVREGQGEGHFQRALFLYRGGSRTVSWPKFQRAVSRTVPSKTRSVRLILDRALKRR